MSENATSTEQPSDAVEAANPLEAGHETDSVDQLERGTTHHFRAEVTQVLNLVINSLYSHKEVFLRELVSNASDALDKLHFRAISEPELLSADPELKIRLIPDRDANTLTIWDNGIGMTEDELVENLGTVAHSGTQAFLEQLKKLRESNVSDVHLIGEFGVGFYSSYLVADDVEVISRAAGADHAWSWRSDGRESFKIRAAERDVRGTEVVLHLKEEQREFLDEWRLRHLVQRYSDYVTHPIELQVTRPAEEEGGEPEQSFEQINQASALWQRSPEDITDEQYQEFYKHLTHDWEAPLTRTHFRIEGTQLFTGLLFLPQRAPFDLFLPEGHHGLRLYVKRVFIMDDCEDLLPKWLRFVRGVLDSDDLPLNVSRELLQDSRVARVIRKQVVKKTLEMLEQLASERPDDYDTFWQNFGAVLKEGLHFSAEYRDQVANLVRYPTTGSDDLVSLADYVARMDDDQPAIYYALGTSVETLEHSPHLEALRARGYEVLLMTDAVDQWAVQGLTEFEGKPLKSAMDADLELDDSPEAAEDSDETAERAELSTLVDRFAEVLKDKVREVKLSRRLTESPVCLVIPEGGLAAHIERLLRANRQEFPATKRILEINPSHPLIAEIRATHEADPESDAVTEWIEMLYDQALLAEGSPIDDPARFAARMTRLMQAAVGAQRH